MNLTEAARHAGISDRQANHWFHEGLITPTLRKRNGDPAPPDTRDARGYRWELDPEQVLHLVVMADLVRLGVNPVQANSYAHLFVDASDTTTVNGAYVTIQLREVPDGAGAR